MTRLVVDGAKLSCSFGTTPSSLNVIPNSMKVEGKCAATQTDYMPNMNIRPFGMCTCPANPAVVAAQGVPQPCMPPSFTPWMSVSSSLKVDGRAVVTKNSKTSCIYGGQISIITASSVEVR